MSDCIHWSGFKTRDGYGRVNVNGVETVAHRHLYEQAHGPLADDLQLHHICRTRDCVNLEHLQVVTPSEHAKLSLAATKTHCIKGHPLTGENLYLRPNGRRTCRTCNRHAVARYARKAAAA